MKRAKRKDKHVHVPMDFTKYFDELNALAQRVERNAQNRAADYQVTLFIEREHPEIAQHFPHITQRAAPV